MDKYYEKNKQSIKKRFNEYYQDNKERIKANNKKYYDQNKDKINAKRQEIYRLNKNKRCKGCNRILRTSESLKKGFCVVCHPPEIWGSGHYSNNLMKIDFNKKIKGVV